MIHKSCLFLLILCGSAFGANSFGPGNTQHYFTAGDWYRDHPYEPYEVHITEPLQGNVTIGEQTQIQVYLDPGGSIIGDVSIYDTAGLSIRGGTVVGNLSSIFVSYIDIVSGTVQGSIRTLGDGGQLFIRGGSISGPLIQESSAYGITIYGRDFTLDGVPIAPGRYLRGAWTDGVLGCILEDGSPLNTLVSMPVLGDWSLDWGHVTLQSIPEPSAGLLGLLAGLGLLLRRGRGEI